MNCPHCQKDAGVGEHGTGVCAQQASIPGWAWKVLAKTDVSLKQAAWAYGCAKKGSMEEQLLLERLWQVVDANIQNRRGAA